MAMRVLTEEQGSENWLLARRGRITASEIDKALAGKNTKTRKQYIENRVLDLMGIADFRDDAKFFQLGRKHEPFMRGWYQDETGLDVRETGFVLHEEHNWLGVSPDGLVDPDGGIEGKFRVSLRTFHDACIKPITRAYLYQMQACMWVTGRQWWDYVNYWRSYDGTKEQGHIRRVHRDEALINEIESAALVMWRDIVLEYFAQSGENEIVFPWDREKHDGMG